MKITLKVRHILILFISTTFMTGVQLRGDYGLWVPDSKMVYSPHLMFPNHRVPQWDNHQHTAPRPTGVGQKQFFGAHGVPEQGDRTLAATTDVSRLAKGQKLLIEKDGGNRPYNIARDNESAGVEHTSSDSRSESDFMRAGYQRRLELTQNTTHLNLDEVTAGQQQTSSGLENQLSDSGKITVKRRNGFGGMGKYIINHDSSNVRQGPEFWNLDAGRYSSDVRAMGNHRSEPSEVEHQNVMVEIRGNSSGNTGNHQSDILSGIIGFQNSSTTNHYSSSEVQNENSESSAKIMGGLEVQDARDYSLHDSQVNTVDVSRDNVWNGPKPGMKEDFADPKKTRYNVISLHSDSVQNFAPDEKYVIQDQHHFTEDKQHGNSGIYEHELRDKYFTDSDGAIRLSEDGKERNRFEEIIWSGDADTVVGREHTSDKQLEGHHFNEYNHQDTSTGLEDGGLVSQRNLFHDSPWTNGGSSERGHRVPEVTHESDGIRLSGTSWYSDYNSDGVGYHAPTYEHVADGEPFKTSWHGATDLHHGGHPLRTGTRVETGPPTAVSTYVLPNGTRVVRLRRIVRYRVPQIQEEDQPRTFFGDIARNLVQKKVAKFLSLFTIIKFPNEPCQTAEGVNGTCYHHLECRSLGGVASGVCAQGYGVCCYFERTCGEITRQNCSYFVNPGFPSPITNMLACILQVEKSSPEISQIRLDFFMFEMLGPTNGTCIDDQFIVTGQNTNSIVPIICGINTGQHVYMDVDSTSGPFRLNMLTTGGDQPRSFRVKVTQIKKGSPLEAPRNCLQYHRGLRGSIESFNYQMLAGSNLPTRPGYMNNLNYAICIRKEPGYCTITYSNTASDGTNYDFQLTNIDQDGQPLIPPGQAGAEVFNCPDDYIVINGIRLCGERLNDASVQLDFSRNYPVTDTSNGPFMIPVRTNGNTNGRGFRIDYQQNSCAT